MRWSPRTLRGNAVHVRVGEDGRPAADASGRVDVIYKLHATAKVYRAGLKNLDGDSTEVVELELAALEPAAASAASAGPSGPAGDAVIIYTDGACTGNPGPMGIGVVIMDGRERREISEFIGEGTNNIAELTAILRALESVPAEARTRPVVVHSDSAYSIGLLTQSWKAKKNQDLVAELRALARGFPRLRFVKVAGHAGVPENERCDQLATAAAARGR